MHPQRVEFHQALLGLLGLLKVNETTAKPWVKTTLKPSDILKQIQDWVKGDGWSVFTTNGERQNFENML